MIGLHLDRVIWHLNVWCTLITSDQYRIIQCQGFIIICHHTTHSAESLYRILSYRRPAGKDMGKGSFYFSLKWTRFQNKLRQKNKGVFYWKGASIRKNMIFLFTCTVNPKIFASVNFRELKHLFWGIILHKNSCRKIFMFSSIGQPFLNEGNAQ